MEVDQQPDLTKELSIFKSHLKQTQDKLSYWLESENEKLTATCENRYELAVQKHHGIYHYMYITRCIVYLHMAQFFIVLVCPLNHKFNCQWIPVYYKLKVLLYGIVCVYIKFMSCLGKSPNKMPTCAFMVGEDNCD